MNSTQLTSPFPLHLSRCGVWRASGSWGNMGVGRWKNCQQFELELLGESCLRETSDFFHHKKHQLFICFLESLHVLHLFYVFFSKPACGSIEKTQKKVPRKSTRSKIALSGCQSSLQLRKKKAKKRQETAFTESKDAAVPVWAAEIGRMVLDSCEWFSGYFVHLEKKVSPTCVHVVSLSCQAQLLPLAYSTGIWLSFSWLHQPWCPMYETKTTHYLQLQHCCMANGWAPSPTWNLLFLEACGGDFLLIPGIWKEIHQ